MTTIHVSSSSILKVNYLGLSKPNSITVYSRTASAFISCPIISHSWDCEHVDVGYPNLHSTEDT